MSRDVSVISWCDAAPWLPKRPAHAPDTKRHSSQIGLSRRTCHLWCGYPFSSGEFMRGQTLVSWLLYARERHNQKTYTLTRENRCLAPLPGPDIGLPTEILNPCLKEEYFCCSLFQANNEENSWSFGLTLKRWRKKTKQKNVNKNSSASKPENRQFAQLKTRRTFQEPQQNQWGVSVGNNVQ